MGLIEYEAIDADRRDGMDEDRIQQEYFLNVDVGLAGAYYTKQLELARTEGGITALPYDPTYPTQTPRAWPRRVAPLPAPFQQLAQTIRTDLDAILAWTPLRVRSGALEGMPTTGKAIRDRACGLPRTWRCTAHWFEKLHDETAQTEADTEGNEHGTVDDVSALHTRSLRS